MCDVVGMVLLYVWVGFVLIYKLFGVCVFCFVNKKYGVWYSILGLYVFEVMKGFGCGLIYCVNCGL